MKVYIASPVRPILEDNTIKSPFRQFQKVIYFARFGCEAIKAMGDIPVSPILAFDGVYDEFTERDKIDVACEALLLACDAIYIVPTPYNAQIKGIANEIEIVKKTA